MNSPSIRLCSSPLHFTAATLRAHLAHLQSSHPAPAAPPAVPATYSTQALPIRPLPTHSSTISSRLAATLPNSDSHSPSAQLQSTLELARKWRITGRSVFLIELARGMRAKREMVAKEREAGKGKGKGRERDEGAEGEGEREFVKKGVVVRLETFYEG